MSPYLIFILSLVTLIYSSNLIIDNSKHIALKFNISKLIIGVTIVAFGTSLPELIVGIFSSIQEKGDIALSNVIGSNVANIGLVLGILALIKPINININEKLNYNLAACLLSTFSVVLIIYLYDGIYFWSGSLLILVFLLYMFYLFSHYSRDNSFLDSESQKFNFICIIKLIIGFVCLSFGTDYFIKSVVEISNQFGFTNNIAISMSLVAFGTSVPELTTSLVAVFKKEQGLAIGNIIGSNIFNILLVAGISSIANPINIEFILIKYHLYFMVFLTVFFIFSIYLLKKINRIISFIFICTYFVFLYINFS